MIYNEDNFQRIDGPTPAGGTYSVAFFYDKDNNPTTKDKAERINITEYDKDDNELRRTTLTKSNNENNVSN